MLIRVAGVFVFLPIPGITAGPAAARIVFSLAFTFALAPGGRSDLPVYPLECSSCIAWAVGEAAFGLVAGVWSVHGGDIVMGAQILGATGGHTATRRQSIPIHKPIPAFFSSSRNCSRDCCSSRSGCDRQLIHFREQS